MLKWVYLIFIPIVTSLYEDQVGKFDWRKQLIGNVQSGQFSFDETTLLNQFITTTDKNVIASLNSKTGELIWRQIGKNSYSSVLVRLNDIIVVSGEKDSVVQSFDLSRGLLRWDWAVENDCGKKIHLIDVDGKSTIVLVCEKLYSFDHDGELMWSSSLNKENVSIDFTDMMIVQDSSEIFVIGRQNKQNLFYRVSAKTGHVIGNSKSSSLMEIDKCFVMKNELLCAEFDSGLILKLSPESDDINVSEVLKIEDKIKSFTRLSPRFVSIIVGGLNTASIFKYENTKLIPVTEPIPNTVDVKVVSHQTGLFFVLASEAADGFRKISWLDATTGKENERASTKIESLEINGLKQIFPTIELGSDSSVIYKTIVQGSDYTLACFENHSKNPTWIRQEALSQILSVEMLDLPLSESQASVESEFSTTGESLTSMFTKRITTQARQIQRTFLRLANETLILLGALGTSASPSDWFRILKGASLPHSNFQQEETSLFERDYFNLHKIIVVTTGTGKIFGLDNRQGKVLWQFYVPDILPFESDGKETMPLFVLRTTAHFPYSALCALMGRHKTTNNAHLIVFDPVVGKVKESVVFDSYPKQIVLLPVETGDESYGLAVLGRDNELYIYPKYIETSLTATLTTKPFFILDVDRRTGTGVGYRLQGADPVASEISQLVKWGLQRVWELRFPLEKGDKLVDVQVKRYHERLHSQGRVLGDRSVLYKYANPNLVVASIEKLDEQGKTNFLIYLFDAVTGTVISSILHRRVSRPFHMVHCENWVIYSFFNEKFRRTEMAVIELYEGKNQTDPDRFSSFAARPPPIVMRQSYIFPHGITAMAVTDTEKGITSRHLLISMPFGAVLEMHRSFLDPRRLLMPTVEESEEGLIPYVPELPIITEHFINYNQSVYNVRNIHTSPTGLESTSCVLVYGLDLFYTRVHPSATFDILKDDFDHWLISVMLLGLFLASVMTKRLAKMKDLNLAWK